MNLSSTHRSSDLGSLRQCSTRQPSSLPNLDARRFHRLSVPLSRRPHSETIGVLLPSEDESAACLHRNLHIAPSSVSGRPVTPVSWYMIKRELLSVPVWM